VENGNALKYHSDVMFQQNNNVPFNGQDLMKHSRYFNWLSALSVALSLVFSAAISAENNKPKDKIYPAFKYSETATDPVIEYNLVHDMIAEPDPEPLLRVYGNGRVHVHYPAYMKKSGDYELQLSKPELDALIRELANDGIIDFDKQAVKQHRKLLQQQRQAENRELYYFSDSSHSVIDIQLDEYQKSPSAVNKKNIRKHFTWPNLKQDAQNFPGSLEITGASRAADRLESLKNDEDLVKTR